MIKSFKYLLLGIGIGITAASFFVPIDSGFEVKPPVTDVQADLDIADTFSFYSTSDYSKETEKTSTTDPGDDKEKGILEITIPPGTDSLSAARILYQSGLIEDPEQFNRKVVEMGLDTKIKAGKYNIFPGADADEIILIITGRYSQNR